MFFEGKSRKRRAFLRDTAAAHAASAYTAPASPTTTFATIYTAATALTAQKHSSIKDNSNNIYATVLTTSSTQMVQKVTTPSATTLALPAFTTSTATELEAT